MIEFFMARRIAFFAWPRIYFRGEWRPANRPNPCSAATSRAKIGRAGADFDHHSPNCKERRTRWRM